MPHFALSTYVSLILAIIVVLTAIALMLCRPISDRELLKHLRAVNVDRGFFTDLIDMIFNAWLLRRYALNFPNDDKELRDMLNEIKRESSDVIRLAAKRAMLRLLRRTKVCCCDSAAAYRRMIASATYLNIEVAPGIVREFENRALGML